MSAYDRLLTRHAQDDDDELFIEAIFGDPDLVDALVERGKLEQMSKGTYCNRFGEHRPGCGCPARPLYALTREARDNLCDPARWLNT